MTPDDDGGLENFELHGPDMEAMLQKINEDFAGLFASFGGDAPPPITLDQINQALRYRPPPPPQPVREPGLVRYHDRIEYLLPCKQLDALATMPSWIRDLAPKTDAKETLSRQWSLLTHTCHQHLATRLLEYVPYSIVEANREFWLRLLLPGHKTDESIGYQARIQSPMSRHEVESRLREIGFETNSCLVEFLGNFCGLAESHPATSGAFLGHEPWRLCNEDDWMSQIEGYDRWRGSLFVHNGLSGNALLLHPRGEVGWWFFAEHEIHFAFASFEAAIEDWVDFNRQFQWPYEARCYVEDNEEARRR